MNLPELSIKRHVLAWMLSGVLVLFGVISYQRIGMDRLPYPRNAPGDDVAWEIDETLEANKPKKKAFDAEQGAP